MVKTVRILVVIVACLLVVPGCQRKRQYYPRTMPERTVEIIRFDSALLAIRANHAADDVQALYADYPDFMSTFVEQALGVNAIDTDYLAEALPLFVSDTMYGFKQTNAREQEVFADISDIQSSLNKAFSRILYLYPETEIPTLYLFISGFNASIFFEEDLIGIGADMYLGSDYEYYNRVVYEYQKQTMRKECIPVDVVSAYLFRTLPYTSDKSRLLDQMMYRGKIMYLTAQIFDELPGYEVMGWTKEQWNWCVKNERGIWHLVMDKRDLFKTESLVLTSYLNDGPFTSEVSQDSPGRLGIWIGWRIAESYMEHNESVSLQELMAEGDAQKILENSYYKP